MDQRVVLVTGSARGLGLAVARAFRECEARVHVTWRNSQSLARELQGEFPDRLHQVDLAEADATHRLIESIVEQDGQLDHIVHCVGEYVSGPTSKQSAQDARRMWTSNVETAMHLFDAARPHLRSSHGTSVFFGCAGLEGLRGRRDVSAYAAAKSALCVLARSWALEEAEYGVRVNLVSPGIIPHEHADPDTHDERLHAAIPLGTPGTPQDIARACLWLSSEDSRHVTGINLPVTGGWQG